MASTTVDLPGDVPPQRRRRGLARLGRGLVRQPAALAAGLVLAALALAGILVQALKPYTIQVNLDTHVMNRPPMLSGWHVFGTNGLGQDILLRTMYGLHTSGESAIFGTLLATLVGVVVGGVAAYRGGWVDAALMRVADTLGIFPAIFVFLLLYFYLYPVTPVKAMLILASCFWIPVARVVRAEMTSLRSREFVQAAVAVGASDTRIFVRHLLPNIGSTVVVAATSLFGQLIMLEATVEFLGLGDSESLTPTLGGLIGDGKRFEIHMGWGWWCWAGPALVLVVLLVSANLLGDGVAEALRPTARR